MLYVHGHLPLNLSLRPMKERLDLENAYCFNKAPCRCRAIRGILQRRRAVSEDLELPPGELSNIDRTAFSDAPENVFRCFGCTDPSCQVCLPHLLHPRSAFLGLPHRVGVVQSVVWRYPLCLPHGHEREHLLCRAQMAVPRSHGEWSQGAT